MDESYDMPLAETAATSWWRDWGRWVLAVVLVSVVAYLTFTGRNWVPILSDAGLGIHEFGHMIFMWAPERVVQLAGSVVQVAAPLALVGYFAWRRDLFATALMLAWTGEAFNNVSIYIYDATRLVLPLFGDDGSGMGHDWANLLIGWRLIAYTDSIAYTVRAVSVLAFFAAYAVIVVGFLQPRLAATRAEAERRRLAALPVREPTRWVDVYVGPDANAPGTDRAGVE